MPGIDALGVDLLREIEIVRIVRDRALDRGFRRRTIGAVLRRADRALKEADCAAEAVVDRGVEDREGEPRR
jgi:hypothetical protein